MSENTELAKADALNPNTALAVLSTVKFDELSIEEQMIQEILKEDEEDNSSDLELLRIKLPTGTSNKFEMGDPSQEQETFSAVVLLVQPTRGYWPKRGQGDPPLCSSSNGITGKVRQDPDQEAMEAARDAKPVRHPLFKAEKPAYECATCTLNEWESAHEHMGGGRGKACKEMRRALIYIDGWKMPSLLSLPPTSIKPWRVYVSRLQNAKSYYFAVRSEFKLESKTAATGDKYSAIQVMDTARLSPEELAAVRIIRKSYKSHVEGLEIGAEDYISEDDSKTYTVGSSQVEENQPPPADWQQREPPPDTSSVLF